MVAVSVTGFSFKTLIREMMPLIVSFSVTGIAIGLPAITLMVSSISERVGDEMLISKLISEVQLGVVAVWSKT